jgi:hypothetical protein
LTRGTGRTTTRVFDAIDDRHFDTDLKAIEIGYFSRRYQLRGTKENTGTSIIVGFHITPLIDRSAAALPRIDRPAGSKCVVPNYIIRMFHVKKANRGSVGYVET